MNAYKVSRAALVSFCIASIFAGAVMADPHRIDEVVITAPKSVGELISGTDVPPPPPPITEPPIMVDVKSTGEKILEILKALCVKSGEGCGIYGRRVQLKCVELTFGVGAGISCPTIGAEALLACDAGQVPSCP
jgi:hypothetical protein